MPTTTSPERLPAAAAAATDPKAGQARWRNEAAPAEERIRDRAREVGFDTVGIAAAAGDGDDARHLTQYLAEGRHGQMQWMLRNADRRADPVALWPAARSVICVGLNYGPVVDPLAVHAEPASGAISVYARGRDYHDVMRVRLKTLARWVADTFACDVKIFVDTAPVMEKPLAMRAGIGWIGKHTNLVSRRFGSWLFLGEVFTTLELRIDRAEPDHCGTCDACMRACPTNAIAEPYRLDPRRCVSYLTIEHAGGIDPTLAARFGNRIYGCDDCLAACPWNKFATPTPHDDMRPRADLTAPKLARLAALDEDGFRRQFRGTAIRRSGLGRMARNVDIARTNLQTR